MGGDGDEMRRARGRAENWAMLMGLTTARSVDCQPCYEQRRCDMYTEVCDEEESGRL